MGGLAPWERGQQLGVAGWAASGCSGTAGARERPRSSRPPWARDGSEWTKHILAGQNFINTLSRGVSSAPGATKGPAARALAGRVAGQSLASPRPPALFGTPVPGPVCGRAAGTAGSPFPTPRAGLSPPPISPAPCVRARGWRGNQLAERFVLLSNLLLISAGDLARSVPLPSSTSGPAPAPRQRPCEPAALHLLRSALASARPPRRVPAEGRRLLRASRGHAGLSPLPWEQSSSSSRPGPWLRWADCQGRRSESLRCGCRWEIPFLPKSVTGNGSERGSSEAQGSHKGKYLIICDEGAGKWSFRLRCASPRSRSPPLWPLGFGPVPARSEEPSWRLGDAAAGSSAASTPALRAPSRAALLSCRALEIWPCAAQRCGFSAVGCSPD